MTPTPELYITAQRHFRVGTLDADNAAPVSHATAVRIERAFSGRPPVDPTLRRELEAGRVSWFGLPDLLE